jgi:hypothetical protein
MRKTILTAALLALSVPSAFAEGPGRGAGLMAFDLNGDGAVAKAETEQVQAERFAKIDTDKNGYLSEAEFKAHHAAMRAAAGGAERDRPDKDGAQGGVRPKMDADKDGKVSLAEFKAAPWARMQRFDANGDGKIDAAEAPAKRRKG